MYEVFDVSRLFYFGATGKNIESKLLEKDQEIQMLKEREIHNSDAISMLSDKVNELIKEIEIIKPQLP